MGDVGETFEAYNEHKRKEREKKEPSRFAYAIEHLRREGFFFECTYQNITVRVKGGKIVFWPYTGWFCGHKPYGNIKGRGIDHLIRALKNLNIYLGEVDKAKGSSGLDGHNLID